ncbi:hypothetical protein GWK47_052781 [Chionoecetes opilio]|uniref:Uncharacterized protein n=1 Tax=Chionoecetes opilio TaxID=41210 RepID=A0A8J4Y135_CHIOP|nr:hypothetical protein GWK47_052781 [Chionoecetes opilio]
MSSSCWCITGAGEHWPMKYICMLGTQGNSSQRNDSYLFTISVPNSAKQHAGHYQPCMLCQDVTRQVSHLQVNTDLESELAYSALTKNSDALQGLEAFQDVPTFLDTARRFVLLMHAGSHHPACTAGGAEGGDTHYAPHDVTISLPHAVTAVRRRNKINSSLLPSARELLAGSLRMLGSSGMAQAAYPTTLVTLQSLASVAN